MSFHNYVNYLISLFNKLICIFYTVYVYIVFISQYLIYLLNTENLVKCSIVK